MKKASSIICAVVAVIVIIFSAVFCFIEGRLLFSGDWLLHESAVLGFLQYFLRTALCVFGIFVGVAVFIKKFEKIVVFLSTCLVAAIVPAFLFLSNGFGLYLLIAVVSFNLAVLFKTEANGNLEEKI